MTERNPTPAPATLVAIDIAKYRHEVLIEAPGHQRRRRLTTLSTKADYDRLVEALMAYGSPVPAPARRCTTAGTRTIPRTHR